MPGGVRAQPSRSRLGPGDDDSGDDLARSSIDPEDVTAYQEVVYRPPRENDSECDSDEDPTAQEEEDSVPGLFGAFRRRALTAAEREEKLRKVAFMKEMPDDTPAGSVSDYMYKEGVKDQLDKLDYDLVGLLPVKQRVREIAALLVLDKMRRKLGFDTAVPSLHMCFTGAPGTGKTTVAVRMGQILAKMGYCRSGHVVVATRDDLVGQYVGHTAPKTKEVIKQALGGVLLVDEAYYLYNAANDRDYGQESIEILLNFMENNREDLVVVLAGYKDRMDKFFSFIPGMSSRIGNHIDFPNYEVDELFEISKVMSRDLDYEMTDEAGDVFKKYIERRMAMPFFSNARTVRNAMDRARMNAAIRVFDQAVSGKNNGDVGADEAVRALAGRRLPHHVRPPAQHDERRRPRLLRPPRRRRRQSWRLVH